MGGMAETKAKRDDPPAAAHTETLAQQVYRRISDAIMTGQLAPGSKISEPALAREYGVSRGPLREALHRLQERRLITRSPNHGPRVITPTPGGLTELFIVREALEGLAAKLAAQYATDAEIAELRSAVSQHAHEVEDPGEAAAYRDDRHNRDFHSAIARCSRNPMLIDLLCGELYALLRVYRGIGPSPQARSRPAAVEHERIVSAIEDRDPELAELLMRRHVAAARRRREVALTNGAESTRTESARKHRQRGDRG